MSDINWLPNQENIDKYDNQTTNLQLVGQRKERISEIGGKNPS